MMEWHSLGQGRAKVGRLDADLSLGTAEGVIIDILYVHQDAWTVNIYRFSEEIFCHFNAHIPTVGDRRSYCFGILEMFNGNFDEEYVRQVTDIMVDVSNGFPVVEFLFPHFDELSISSMSSRNVVSVDRPVHLAGAQKAT